MNIEIKKQLAEMERQHTNDLDAMILYVLHVHCGFGKERLRRFHKAFVEEHNKLISHYEMPDDNAWLAAEKLKEIGVDVAAWNEETEETK